MSLYAGPADDLNIAAHLPEVPLVDGKEGSAAWYKFRANHPIYAGSKTTVLAVSHQFMSLYQSGEVRSKILNMVMHWLSSHGLCPHAAALLSPGDLPSKSCIMTGHTYQMEKL